MNLLPQQNQALAKQLPNKVGALFMSMGTGKTRVSVDLVNAVPDLDLVLWVGPLRSINPLDKTLPSIKDEIAKWGGFNAKEVIYVGVESIGQSDKTYLKILGKVMRTLNTFMIIDESIKVKNPDAKRTKRMQEISKWIEYKFILNGEPITRDLLDLWSQFNILDPRIFNMNLAEFKNTFCKYTTVTKRFGNTYKTHTKEYITGYENIDYLYSLIGEYVFECDLQLDIKQIFETINYQLSSEEKERYQLLKEKYLDDEKLMMMNNNIFLEMTMKMQHEYCCSESKFEAVYNWIIDESKTIIFCKFIASANECRKRFPKATVLNYKTGSMSLNLQHLPYTVYFDGTFDWGDVSQSQKRNYRTGAEIDCKYLNLIGNVGLEKLMQDNNKKKLGMSEYLKKISREQLREIL